MVDSLSFLLCGTLLILTMWICSLLNHRKSKGSRCPPGPIQMPLIGNLLHMLPAVLKPPKKSFTSITGKYWTYKPAYIIMDEISAMYGPVTNLQFGINHAIIVSSAEYAKSVCTRDEFAARFADGWFVERSFGKPLGLIFNNGEHYKGLKKFTNRMLKDFGFGKKKNMEGAIKDELIDFIYDFGQKLDSSQGNVLYMRHMFTLPVLNVLWNMIGGVRFSYDDTRLHHLITTVEELSRTFDIGGNILMAFPFLRHVIPGITGHSHQMKLYGELHQFFREILNERMRDESYAGNPRDFIDIFIQEIQKQKGTANEALFTEEQFIMVCLDLFTAGSETTANTLDFAILYMLLNPEVQRKVQQEIDTVVGPNRLPTMQDRTRMPYTEATLLEIQRVCNVIPLVHRVCTADTNLGPYSIENGAVILINLHSIHMDKKTWGDPTAFRPERFLDSSGALKSHPSFLPFGMGKRVCMGEFLAKLTLFTYFTAILQRFSFHVSAEHGPPVLSPGKGFTLSPDPYHAQVKIRT